MSVASEVDQLPVIIGVGQARRFWDGDGDAPSPVSLASAAIEHALRDCRCADPHRLCDGIDTLFCVRTMRDSLPGLDDPQTRYDDLPASIADSVGLSVTSSIYSAVGGDQPQSLVYEACRDVFSGERECVAIVGAEATAAVKLARRKQLELDWSLTAPTQSEDRGFGEMIITPYEFSNGLGLPKYSYAFVDHALRARYGWSIEQYRQRVGRLLAGFSEVAVDNDHACFRDPKDAAFLSTPSDANPLIADPFLKWFMAQDSVNQGAAVIITSVSNARAMGVPESQWVYLHSFASARDCALVHRQDLSHSEPMRTVLSEVLDRASLAVDDIDALDLYSCFPSVVLLACEYLGIDPMARPLTVTGGLPFFGGPGNNYSLHAIAEVVARCRARPETNALVLANGGYLSKLAAATYSAAAPNSPEAMFASETTVTPVDDAVAIDESINNDARIESYCVAHERTGPRFALLMTRSEQGRALARVQEAATLARFTSVDPIGLSVREFNDNV
ncbi:MAG: acetyl-CoA acetyltransferase [Pseudomonadota bacterium]